MESYCRRLNDLMLLVEEVAFRRMDERLLDKPETKSPDLSARAFCRNLVGTVGFEPTTPCTPCKCATKLRYAPIRSVPTGKT